MVDNRQVGDANCRRADFTWKIKDFSSLSRKVGCYYQSPDIYFQDRCWYLELLPNGEKHCNSDYVGLYLVLDGSGPPIELPCSLGIQAADGKTQVLRNITHTFKKKTRSMGCEDYIRRSELFLQKDELLPRDILTIIVTLKEDGEDDECEKCRGTKEASIRTEVEHKVADVSIQTEGNSVNIGKQEAQEKSSTTSAQREDEHKLADVSTQTEDYSGNDGKKEVQDKSGAEKLVQDIGKLWGNDEYSDFVLKVRDVQFKVHRNILAVRSPVLGAMFQHDSAEKASGEATIDDCDPAVFEQLLRYIYSGAPQVLDAENAAALYVLADKYLVSEVKALCAQCMKKELCLDTFCDYVTLSLMYDEGELLQMAIDYFSRNKIRVMKTVDWQRFLSEHPTWANEILIRDCELTETRNGEYRS